MSKFLLVMALGKTSPTQVEAMQPLPLCFLAFICVKVGFNGSSV